MKKIGYLLLLILMSLSAHAEYFEVDISNRVISFADLAKYGKTSAFIISTHYCAPCLAMKNQLLLDYGNSPDVDIYYCLLTKDNYDHHYNKRESFLMYQNIDEATSQYPLICLFSSTRNLYSFYTGFSEEKYAVLSKAINHLVESSEQYFDQSLMSVEEDAGAIAALSIENQNLKLEIQMLKDSISRMDGDLLVAENRIKTKGVTCIQSRSMKEIELAKNNLGDRIIEPVKVDTELQETLNDEKSIWKTRRQAKKEARKNKRINKRKGRKGTIP